MYEGGDGKKILKPFPAYPMNPANPETFHPQNFCRLRYLLFIYLSSFLC